jgi:hypothetical protein
MNEPVLILLVLAGLVQPVSISDDDDTEQYEIPEELIEFALIIISFILVLLSLSAYLVTKFKRLLFAVGAFGLFFLYSVVDFLEDLVPFIETPYTDIISSSILLAVLILFFLAITKRK